MWALNLKRSPENGEFWVRADPFSRGAGETGGALMTSAARTSGVSDSIELHNGKHSTRRATIKGSWGTAQGKYPSMAANVKRGGSNGRVASDGGRYAAMASDEAG